MIDEGNRGHLFHVGIDEEERLMGGTFSASTLNEVEVSALVHDIVTFSNRAKYMLFIVLSVICVSIHINCLDMHANTVTKNNSGRIHSYSHCYQILCSHTWILWTIRILNYCFPIL